MRSSTTPLYAQPRLPNFINGSFTPSTTDHWLPVHDPATNKILCHVPQTTPAELELAADSAEAAGKKWREVPVQQRVRVLYKFAQAIRDDMENLAGIITREQGKTLADARGDVFRGLEVVEHAFSVPSLILGDSAENLATNVDTYTIRQPLGVTAGVNPFNFPAMIPLWNFMSIACGNALILKPSERVPGAAMRLAELAHQVSSSSKRCLGYSCCGCRSIFWVSLTATAASCQCSRDVKSAPLHVAKAQPRKTSSCRLAFLTAC